MFDGVIRPKIIHQEVATKVKNFIQCTDFSNRYNF